MPGYQHLVLHPDPEEVISLRVARSSFEEVAPFVAEHHYSGCVPHGRNVFFRGLVPRPSEQLGLFGEAGEETYAAAVYGWGVNPYQETFLSRLLGREVTRASCFELKRLVRAEPANPGLPLPSFLGAVHRLLRRDGIRYIVAFSDPAHGHTGGIYRAANFVHSGRTQEEIHCVDAAGERVHRRRAYRFARGNDLTIAQAREALGLRTVRTARKDRWLLDLHVDLRRNPPKPVDV